MVFRQEDRAQQDAWPNTLDAANDNGGNRRPLAYAAAVSFRFPGGESEKTSEQVDERSSAPGVNKKKVGKGVGMGRKGIACSQSHWFYWAPFTQEREAII